MNTGHYENFFHQSNRTQKKKKNHVAHTQLFIEFRFGFAALSRLVRDWLVDFPLRMCEYCQQRHGRNGVKENVRRLAHPRAGHRRKIHPASDDVAEWCTPRRGTVGRILTVRCRLIYVIRTWPRHGSATGDTDATCWCRGSLTHRAVILGSARSSGVRIVEYH